MFPWLMAYCFMNEDVSIEFSYSIEKEKNDFFKEGSLVNALEKESCTLTTLELLDKLDNVINSVIKLYYRMESSVLANDDVKDEQWYELSLLKRLNAIYKRKLHLPQVDTVDLPYDIENDYKILLRKIKELVKRTKDRIISLNEEENNNFLIEDYNLKLKKLIRVKKLYEVFLS